MPENTTTNAEAIFHLPDPASIVILRDNNSGEYTITTPGDRSSDDNKQTADDADSTLSGDQKTSFKDYLNKQCEAIEQSGLGEEEEVSSHIGPLMDMHNNEKSMAFDKWVADSEALIKMNNTDYQKQKMANIFQQRKTHGAFLTAAYMYDLKELAKQIAALAPSLYPAEEQDYASNFIFALYVGLLFPEKNLLPVDFNIPEQLENILEKAMNELRENALNAMDPIMFGSLDKSLWAYHCDLTRDFLQSIRDLFPRKDSDPTDEKSLKDSFTNTIQASYDDFHKKASATSPPVDVAAQSLEHIRLEADNALNLNTQIALDVLGQGNDTTAVLEQFYQTSQAFYQGFSSVVSGLTLSPDGQKPAAEEAALMQHVLSKSQAESKGYNAGDAKKHLNKLTIMRHLISHPEARNECFTQLGDEPTQPPKLENCANQEAWLDQSYEYFNTLTDKVIHRGLGSTILARVQNCIQGMLNFPSNSPPTPSRKKLNPSNDASTAKTRSWWNQFTRRFFSPASDHKDPKPPTPGQLGS